MDNSQLLYLLYPKIKSVQSMINVFDKSKLDTREVNNIQSFCIKFDAISLVAEEYTNNVRF